MNCKVSVIVPIYNVEHFLRKCIESIQQQTYTNLEIILVDDGSLDLSGKICDEISKLDSRIKVVHKQNEGVSAARNSGINIATGEFVCFVDGDDYVMPDYVEYLLTLIYKYEADIAVSTEMFSNFIAKQCDNVWERIYSGERATESILCYDIPIGVYNKLFKRDFLGNHIRFLPELCIGEGFYFNTMAFQRANKIAVSNRRVYFYRRDNINSVTTKFDAAKWKNGLYALQRIKQDFVIHTDRIQKAWEFAWWRTNTDVYDLLILANAVKRYPDLYRDCRRVMRQYAFSCFKVPASNKQRIRALILFFCPRLIPQAMVWRRKRFKVDVTN